MGKYKSTGIGLSPPWDTYYSKLKYSVGVTPGVNVGALIPINDSLYIVVVTVDSVPVGLALATLLKQEMQFDEVKVMVFVQDQQGTQISPIPGSLTAFEIAQLFLESLTGNAYFDNVVVRPFAPGEPNAVYPVFKPEVIQFFDDNLADLYSNFNGVAADVFRDVMKDAISDVDILYSTTPKEA